MDSPCHRVRRHRAGTHPAGTLPVPRLLSPLHRYRCRRLRPASAAIRRSRGPWMSDEELGPEQIAAITAYVDVEALPPDTPTTVFIFGTNQPTPVRLAADRYHRGNAPLIIATGGINRHNGIVEGREFHRLLREDGVPEGAVRCDDTSANTWQNVGFAMPHLREGPGRQLRSRRTAPAECGNDPQLILAHPVRYQWSGYLHIIRCGVGRSAGVGGEPSAPPQRGVPNNHADTVPDWAALSAGSAPPSKDYSPARSPRRRSAMEGDPAWTLSQSRTALGRSSFSRSPIVRSTSWWTPRSTALVGAVCSAARPSVAASVPMASLTSTGVAWPSRPGLSATSKT